ncbi:MAG: hypothetical protein FJ088_04435 [Deltaproteobacteria bacterium]|nr:hypothetical protein [Deltaproteobacteria bacterium]
MAPLLCSICNYSEGHCECKEGVDYKFYGLGGSVCINVIIHDGNEPRILKNVSEFSSTFAPVEDKAEALAFVDLAVHRTRHLFTREEFIAAATHVEGGYYSHKAACLKEHITGTSAGETPDGYVVSTFLVPDPNGCIKEAIVEIKVLVTKQGVLKILSEEALCLAYEGMACYD